MSTIIRFGLDLAKNSCSVCGVDAHEKVQIQKTFKRGELLEYFAQQSLATVAMESGSGTHHWARKLQEQDHDAAAISEAAGRPCMRFVPIKSGEQQAILVVHRLRSSTVADHTRLIN